MRLFSADEVKKAQPVEKIPKVFVTINLLNRDSKCLVLNEHTLVALWGVIWSFDSLQLEKRRQKSLV